MATFNVELNVKRQYAEKSAIRDRNGRTKPAGGGSVTFATRISQVLVEREGDQGYLISQLAAAALSRK